jgi:hypothetical protein
MAKKNIPLTEKPKTAQNNTTTQRAVQNGSNRRQPVDNPSKTAHPRLQKKTQGQLACIKPRGSGKRKGYTKPNAERVDPTANKNI